MKKLFFLAVVCLILFLPIVFSAKYYLPDENTFKDTRNFDITHFPDGSVEIQGNRIGIAVTGVTLTGNALTNTKDFLWTWTYDANKKANKYQLQGKNDSANFQIIQDWNLTNKPKITFIITNKQASMTNTKFWWIIVLDKEDIVRFANEEIHARNQTRNFDVNAVKNFSLIPEISDKFGFDFQDVKDAGFSLAGIKIVDGTDLGYPNQIILGIGFTKNNGFFPINTTIIIDPTIVNTGYKFPTSSGVLAKNQYAQWINSGALTADDSNYASLLIMLGDRVTVGDFNFGIQPDWAIRSINIRGDAQVNNYPNAGSAEIGVTITDENGESYGRYRTKTWTCPAFAFCNDSTKTFTVAIDNLEYPHNFKKSSLENGNFMVDIRIIALTGVVKLDYVQVSIDYIDGIDTNVTTHADPTEDIFHLTIADTNTQAINWDTTAFYSNFNVRTDFNVGSPEYTFDLSRNQAETQFTDSAGLGSGWQPGCWAGTGCYHFIGDLGTTGAYLETEPVIDLDFNKLMTVNLQYNPDANLVSLVPLGAIVDGANYSIYTVFSTTGTLIRFRSAGIDCNSATPIYPSRFTQVTGTRDNSTMRVYLNGVLSKTCANTTSMRSGVPTPTIMIGRSLNETDFISGKVDELILLDTNLSVEQIKDLNIAGQNIFYPTGRKDFNGFSITSTHNSIDVFDTNANIPSDSNATLQIGDFNSAYFFGTATDGNSIFSGTDYNFYKKQVHTPTNFALRWNLYSGGTDSNNFYTPIIDVNVRFNSARIPCGNYIWNTDLNMSCNCTVTEPIDLNKHNAYFTNTGTFSTITFLERVFNFATKPLISGQPTCRIVANKRFG